MDAELLESLQDIGYKGPLCNNLESAVELGPSSQVYTTFVSDLVCKLSSFYRIGIEVSPITADNDHDSTTRFLAQIEKFLNQYGCPYEQLTGNVDMSARLASRESRLLLLVFLTSEYQAAQIQFSEDTVNATSQSPEPTLADYLKQALLSLRFPKPPANVTPSQLFTKLEATLKQHITDNPELMGSPLLRASLSSKQWERLGQINSRLSDEYDTRGHMLLKRLDVTIKSFLWNDKVQEKQDEAARSYQPHRNSLRSRSTVTLAHLLAARDSLLVLEKTNSNRTGMETPVNKVIIGNVPDRGGRTSTMEAPAVEMPSFRAREAGPPSNRGGRGSGGHQRGGRVQGGWSASYRGREQGGRGGYRGRGGRGAARGN